MSKADKILDLDSSNSKFTRAQERSRIGVRKTYKLFIGGVFPRTESGRFYDVKNAHGDFVASVCLSSRKDFRNAVEAARGAFSGWFRTSAFLRSQILYRMAEMMECRREQFIEELACLGRNTGDARIEVESSIDRILYFAGWADKYQQVFSSVNPVQSSHFNFSMLEPMGVVGIVAPKAPALLGLVGLIAPVIVGGNTAVVLASEDSPFSALSLSEVMNDSDLPAGVVNILTGSPQELLPHFYSHMDVNGLANAISMAGFSEEVVEAAAENIKRVHRYLELDCNGEEAKSPYLICDFQELKTTWHPIGTQG